MMLSVDDACLYLVTFVVLTPVKTIRELFRPAFGVLPKTGHAEPADRGKPGWGRSAHAQFRPGNGKAACLG